MHNRTTNAYASLCMCVRSCMNVYACVVWACVYMCIYVYGCVTCMHVYVCVGKCMGLPTYICMKVCKPEGRWICVAQHCIAWHSNGMAS